MVRSFVERLFPQPLRRELLLVFEHPVLGRVVLHHPDQAHMLLVKGDVAVTAARFYLKPYFKYLSDIDLHHYHRQEFKVGRVEYSVVHFDFPVVCDKEKALVKLMKARHQFISVDTHRFKDQISKVLGRP